MVSAFLKICPMCPTIAHSFAEILRYYGEEFDGDRMVIHRGEIITLEPTEITKSEDILVLDPFRGGINAAATFTRLDELKSLFSSTHRRIMSLQMESSESRKTQSILESIYSDLTY